MNHFSIDRRTGVLLVKFTGALTVEALRAFDREVEALMAAAGSMPAIIDFTDIPSVDLATPVVVERGKRRRLMTSQPRVFVSPSTVLFGVLRMYGAYQEGIGEKAPTAVRSLTDAFEALSVVDPEFEPIAIPPPPAELPTSV